MRGVRSKDVLEREWSLFVTFIYKSRYYRDGAFDRLVYVFIFDEKGAIGIAFYSDSMEFIWN